MQPAFQPTGHNGVAPYLVVDSAAETIARDFAAGDDGTPVDDALLVDARLARTTAHGRGADPGAREGAARGGTVVFPGAKCARR